ncbi:MAG: putative toxin-antitoxin system toxin component, PIN family [Bacteroidota bacterium]
MNKLRLVIDTNVFLVALAPNFRLHWIYEYLLEEKFELCVTTEILNEYQEIISSRYGLSKTDNTLDFLLLLPNVIQVNPSYKWNLLKDEDDNKFVDCAVAGNADFIISNDKDFNILESIEFPSVSVLRTFMP